MGDLADPADQIRTVTEYRERRLQSLERLQGMAALLEAEAGAGCELRYRVLTRRAGIRSAEATVAWCDKALQVLDQLEASARPRVHTDDDPADREERAS